MQPGRVPAGVSPRGERGRGRGTSTRCAPAVPDGPTATDGEPPVLAGPNTTVFVVRHVHPRRSHPVAQAIVLPWVVRRRSVGRCDADTPTTRPPFASGGVRRNRVQFNGFWTGLYLVRQRAIRHWWGRPTQRRTATGSLFRGRLTVGDNTRRTDHLTPGGLNDRTRLTEWPGPRVQKLGDTTLVGASHTAADSYGQSVSSQTHRR